MKNGEKKTKYWHGGVQHWHFIALLLILFDIFAANISYFLALWFRFSTDVSAIPPYFFDSWKSFTPWYSIICVVLFMVFRLYQTIWRYAGVSEAVRLVIANIIAAAVHTALITLIYRRMPISYYAIGAFIQLMMTLFVRYIYLIFLIMVEPREARKNAGTRAERVMIIGAGNGGQTVADEIAKSSHINARVMCFIDDNPNKWKRYIGGIPVVGGRDAIVKNAEKYDIEKIIFAIPTLSRKEKSAILNICGETGCRIQSVPGIYQILNGDKELSDIRDIDVTDLLGRDSVDIDTESILGALNGKVIMVTGGGGSIGAELCRQIAYHNPKRLIIFDIYENSAYEVQQELRRGKPNLDLQVVIGSVRDSRRLKDVFERYRPEIVYHAAAHKHVPLMENNPWEAVKNNAIGTYKTAYAAVTHGCEQFVFISTDKAVNPTNVMGASKRLGEMVVQTFAEKIKEGKISGIPQMELHEDADAHGENPEFYPTRFVTVRFGNVLGSNGSVVPLFRKQIEAGGPVTVTHPNVVRYFMTIPEAVSLTLQAGAYGKNGEIMVLDMGEPIKIDTLARNLIRLSGYRKGEIEIKYVGLRPGEKMYEEKLMDSEGLKTTANKLIFIGKPTDFDGDKFLSDLRELMEAAYEHRKDIKQMIAKIVPTYTPE